MCEEDASGGLGRHGGLVFIAAGASKLCLFLRIR